MATFTDLVRAQKQAGKSAVTSLSGAYNQMNMQRFDPRNALFSKSGLMTALFPSLKGYQATPISRKNIPSSVSPLAQQGVSDSPTVLKSIARDSRTSARNSMALPSIARNIAQLVRISGGTPAKYFEGAKQKEEQYETKFGTGKKGLPGLGKTAAGGGFNIMSLLGSIGKGVGGIFSGIGSIAGSLVGGAASIVSSIFSGIGSLVGGAFSGVFSVLGGALSGMGFMGIIIAGVLGFALYFLSKSLDFSKLGKGITESFSSLGKGIDKFTDKLTKELDTLTDGEFSKTMKSLRAGFKSFSIQVTSIVEATMEMMSNLVIASIKDVMGRIENFYEDIRLQITGQSKDTKFGPGGMNVSEMGLTSGRSLEELQSKKEQALNMQGDYSFFRRGLKVDPKTGKSEWQDQDMRIKWNRVLDKLDENIAYIQGKEKKQKEKTSNVEKTPTLKELIDQKIREKREADSSTDKSLSGAPLLDLIGKAEGGAAGYDAANKGKAGNLPKGYPGLSKLTVGEVMDLQARKEIYAAGRYQIIPETLKGLVDDKVVKREDQFSPVIQDKLAMTLINRRLEKAGSDPIEQQLELSKEFAAIAVPRDVKNNKGRLVKEGQSFYEGQGGNRALISTATMQKALTGKTPEQQLADNRNAPTPTKSDDASDERKSFTMNSVSKSVADFARDQMIALDKLTGGQLMKGSTELADMLRDVTNELYKELMNNPTLVDNSQKVVNNNVNSGGGGSPTTASAYNSETLRDLLNLQTR